MEVCRRKVELVTFTHQKVQIVSARLQSESRFDEYGKEMKRESSLRGEMHSNIKPKYSEAGAKPARGEESL